MTEPEVAVVFSPREWASRVVRHLTDHGGARVRLRVVDSRVALEESFDVLVADDITSFLDPPFIREMRAQFKAVLGVFDPAEPAGKDALLALGVEEVIPCDASAEEFAARITGAVHDTKRTEVQPAARPPLGGAPRGEAGLGMVTVVGGPPGGAGATEIAIELGRASLRRRQSAAVVDADDVAPSMAQRLHLPLVPNFLTAVDVAFQGGAGMEDCLDERYGVLTGLASGSDWSLLRPQEALEVVAELARVRRNVVVNIGCRVEDVPSHGQGRYATARALLESAGAVVGVGLGTPVGITRLLAWAADILDASGAPLHLVINKAPLRSFQRGEITAEITRVLEPASLHFVPFDPRVARASFRGEPVAAGEFTRAVGRVAESVLAPDARRRLIRK